MYLSENIGYEADNSCDTKQAQNQDKCACLKADSPTPVYGGATEHDDFIDSTAENNIVTDRTENNVITPKELGHKSGNNSNVLSTEL